MTKTPYVLDASALLAALFDEPGADRVEEVLPGARMSTVNFSEVVAKLSERGRAGDDTLRILAELDIVVCDFDRNQAEAAGRLRKATRSAGLSLGDRCCLATAMTRGLPALTAEAAWEPLADVLGVEVRNIRPRGH